MGYKRTWPVLGALVAATLVAPIGQTARPQLEGRAPTKAELTPSVEAAFEQESYPPGATATLEISSVGRGITLQVLQSGPEHVVTRSNLVMNGVPVTPPVSIGSSAGRRAVRLRIGNWESGLYVVRLHASDGRIGYAPFVVRPRRLGEHRVAVVMPTLTWQAYNLRDDDGDGKGDSWYANWKHKTVRLGRPYLSRGVPYNFRHYDLPFLIWLARTRRHADFLAQVDIEHAGGRRLAASYTLVIFPGHTEYVTTREYDAIETYRDRGGNLMFLSANNFYWQVVKHGDVMRRTKPWRDLGRPEARLIGVQYIANGKAPRQPWIVRRTPAGSWIFAGTGLRPGSTLARGGVEIDHVAPASPRSVQVVAEIQNLFGPGKTAEMSYYKDRSGAQVFAAGAFYFTRLIHVDAVVSRIVANIWTRLATR
jgi:hypothetical protein